MFLGFGLPYTVLVNLGLPYFIGYGTFLMLFPFSVILGSILDYKYTNDNKQDDIKDTSNEIVKIRIFKNAQMLALFVIQEFDKKFSKKKFLAKSV